MKAVPHAVPLRAGVGRVAGTVTDDDLLEAPITGRPCAFYEVVCDEWDNGLRTPLLRVTSEQSFKLDTGHGVVSIYPHSSTFALTTDVVRGHSSACPHRFRRFMASQGQSMYYAGELRSFSWRETIIPPGVALCASGVLCGEANVRGHSGYRDLPTSWALRPTTAMTDHAALATASG